MRVKIPVSRHTHTLLGVLAILFWSTTFAVGRPLTEKLGPVTATAATCLVGGTLGCVVLLGTRKQRAKLVGMNRKYLFGCGGLFVLYMVSLFLAIGLASTRQQVIEVGLLNYLWPSLTLVFSVYFLRRKARLLLWPGIVVATAGVILAGLHGEQLSWSQSLRNFGDDCVAYMLALVAAVSWALYSNLSRLWGGKSTGEAVPLFILATGAVMLPICLVFPEKSSWDGWAVGELLFMAVLPVFVAYLCWDSAVKKGDFVLVASLSYLTPLLATVLSCIYLGLNMGWTLWLACGLVIGGSVVCRYSVVEAEETG